MDSGRDRQSGRVFLAALAGLAALWMIAAGPAAGGSSKKAVQGKSAHQEYAAQAEFIQSEIDLVSQNLEWLELKVRDMKDLKQYVPEKLIQSLDFKKKKLASLKALKKRYAQLGKKAAAPSGAPVPESVPLKKAKKTGKSPGGAESLAPALEKAGLADWIAVVESGKTVNLENRLPILFSSASARLAPGYDSFLKNLAGFLKGKDVRIDVRGYADTDPIHTEKYPSNFELGAARASAVVRRLAALGVKPSVCRVVSTGEHRADNARRTTSWKNLQRHVNIFIRILN